MDLKQFVESTEEELAPAGLSAALQALWAEKKGDWTSAHEIVQGEDGKDEAWVHAYLHRKEGDEGNADYWYRASGKSFCSVALDEEWESIAAALLRRN